MKNIFFSVLLLISANMFSQILEPVKWTTSVKKISNSEYELIATANIEDEWHLYSQNVPEGGPVSTQFTFEGNNKYLKKGNTKEEEGQIVDDPTFNMKVKYFENQTTFTQLIKLKSKPPFKINSEVNYMVCDNSKCIMPDPAMLVFNLQ
ncbi:protein-disulfide reductase DsbD domain-containing protein [uncultured Algibacter sp.]|uniref:protein-disulfide reductase DsbD domain-containing protein n=1 Tax=uncultured Algibacter sp. TaxID=298659 RepID=UPI00261EC6E8|nr:protein-disulfide reductase DsbD domain-containing protein [uncultured Algibacter sp.]